MFQQQVTRKMPTGKQQTYLVGYIDNGMVGKTEIRNLSVNTGLQGGTDLNLVAREVSDHLNIDYQVEILSITHLGIK